jgi:EAL domain-containing protein (putative c-di-GMP-specific phosphodiesterase class I)
MQKLKEKGIHFAMDDYGTGFSNTASIIKYPFHTIKLDKSMLWSAMDNEKAMCALKHTSSMIKDMKMELLAEGVETLEQAELLEKMGCDLFQGYYYAKPLCERDFLEKIG